MDRHSNSRKRHFFSSPQTSRAKSKGHRRLVVRLSPCGARGNRPSKKIKKFFQKVLTMVIYYCILSHEGVEINQTPSLAGQYMVGRTSNIPPPAKYVKIVKEVKNEF